MRLGWPSEVIASFQKDSLIRIRLKSRNVALGERSLFLHKRLHVLDGHVVSLHFQIIPQPVIAGGLAVDEKDCRLAVGERVAFDVIRVVVPVQAKLPPKSIIVLAIEWLENIPLRL